MSHQEISPIFAADANVSCPHCQHAVIDWQQEQYVQPCEHTAFIAMDFGFEYAADAFEAVLPVTIDELHESPQLDIPALLQRIGALKLIILKAELGLEGMYRYIGFFDTAK